MEYLNQEKINIDIKYMNRDMLPEFDAEGKRIKPEIKEEKTIPVFDPMQPQPLENETFIAHVGQRRNFSEMNYGLDIEGYEEIE